MAKDSDSDPEKGAAHVRHEHEVERPLSVHSGSTNVEYSHEDGIEEKHRPLDKIGPAATLGQPLGVPDKKEEEEEEEEEEHRRGDLERAQSRASTTRSKALSIIPRSERRGLLGRLALLPEVDRPYDYKNSTKWSITAIISFATAGAPLGSSIFYPALTEIQKEFGSSATVTNLSVAMYMIAMSVFPLWWSSFSEQFGRRTIYVISFSMFVVFSVICANSQNIAMLIVFRILTGGASASVQAVGAGTIADIWESYERGRAMSIFYLGPLLGPIIAPIIGGVLTQELSWRATMYFLSIYGFVILNLIIFLLPETLARKTIDQVRVDTVELSRMTTAESAKYHTKKVQAFMKRAFIDPLSVLLFLRFPPVLLTVFIAAIAFGALFIANIGIQQGFSHAPYNYSQLIVGVLYIPAGLGYFMASLVGGKWIDKIMAREAKKANRYDEKGKLIYLPEDRMRENMWFAHSVYPISLIWFGWSMQYGVQFMCPSIALFCFGISSMLVFSAGTTMLTEFVRKRSSSGVAINNFVRNILSCVGTIVAAPWIDAVGFGWVFTTVGIFCIVAGGLGIWTLRKNAPRWRVTMDEALKDLR